MTTRSCSPGWFKIDPNCEPLRKNPGFQKLVGEESDAGRGHRQLVSERVYYR
jgi:hypothetical protein